MAQQTAPQGLKASKWLALTAAVLAFSYTFLSRYIWSPLMTDVSNEFAINATQAGLYMSAFFMGYLVTQIPGGLMADKLQPKYILIICTLCSGIATALMSVIPGYVPGLLLRIITGICSGCVMASCSKIVAVNFAPQERAIGMGILLASPPFGITLANSIGNPLNAAMGWRKTFLLVGVLAVVVIAALLLFVKPIPKAPASAAAIKKPGMLEGLKVFFSDPQQLILGLSGFMFMFVTVGFATWANTYAGTLGFTRAQGGMVITAYSIAGIVGSCLSGGIAKRLKMSHKNFLLISLVLMSVMTLVFSFQRSYSALMIAGIVYGFVSYLPSTHYTTLAMQRAGDQHSATAASTQNLLFQISSMVQPAVIGAILDMNNNYALIWYSFFICLVISVVVSFAVKKD
ncbi:MFS transporter [Gemmiger formicilis]|uniref:MFS transporter n=1 Tax=Gemmiger formicilis TaxID=745368 RepID=UPI00195DC390|nr:MFS transporter [Gemmiger formicilis]MBM6914958.1 MFS transporter [Gemmiger formicilis]